MRQGKSAQRFVGDIGEQIDIRIEPHGAGNTFTVSGAAVRISGGTTSADATTYRLLIGGTVGGLQAVVMRFRFAEAVPQGGFPAASWPRFDVTLSGSNGGTFKLPSVLQSSVAPVPSAQDLELLFETGAAAPAVREPAIAPSARLAAPRAAAPRAAAPAARKTSRRKPARKKKSARKKSGKKKAAKKKSGKKKPARKAKAARKPARRRGKP
jgi:hypothetical protein